MIGLGSNLIVRDGGVPGVVIRLGRGFSDVKVEGDAHPRRHRGARREGGARGAGGRHCRARLSCAASPARIGGALRMNGGAYGRETKDALIEARGVDRAGQRARLRQRRHALQLPPLRRAGGRHLHRGAVPGRRPAIRAAIAAEMDKITESREATQPIKSRTGGSTFKNPPGHKAWQLIDAAGCRGLTVGAAQVSEMHCNFLINLGGATAADIETLGETVRAAREGEFRRRARLGDQAHRRARLERMASGAFALRD